MFCAEDVGIGTFVEVVTDEFERVFRRHWPHLVRILYRVTGDKGLSEDLAQEALIRFYQRRGRLEKPGAWLYRVVIRLGLDALKSRNRRTRREQVASGAALSSPMPDGQLELAERQGLTRRILASMPQRSVLLLILHYSGFSHAEIGEAAGLKPTSIGTLLSRAERDFKERFLKMTKGARP